MFFRLLSCLVLTTFASCLGAQTSVAFSDSVPDDRYHYYLLEIDHGASPTAIDLTVDATTTSQGGLYSRLYDMTRWSLNDVPWDDAHTIPAGTSSHTMALPARSDVHRVLLKFEAGSSGPDVAYDGTASVSAGSISMIDFDSYSYLTDTGIRNHLYQHLTYAYATNGGDEVTIDLELDFGPTPKSATFYVNVHGTPQADSFELLDITGTPTTLYSVPAQQSSSGNASAFFDERAYTTPDFSGIVTLRLLFKDNGSRCAFIGDLAFGSDVTVQSATVSAPEVKPPERYGPESLGCTARSIGDSSGWMWLMSVALLAAGFTLSRRRRLHSASACPR